MSEGSHDHCSLIKARCSIATFHIGVSYLGIFIRHQWLSYYVDMVS